MKTELYVFDNDNKLIGCLDVPSQGQALDMAQQLSKVNEIGHCRTANLRCSVTDFHITVNGCIIFNATLPVNL